MEARLAILHDAQVIDSEIYSGMLKVINRLEQRWHLNIRHSQGEMMITHMANAMMRARQKKIIPTIDQDVLDEVEASDVIANIREINGDLLSVFAFEITPSEQGYLLANIFSLHLAQSEINAA